MLLMSLPRYSPITCVVRDGGTQRVRKMGPAIALLISEEVKKMLIWQIAIGESVQ